MMRFVQKKPETLILLAGLVISKPALALSITVGGTTIFDGGAGDANPAAGVIDFSLANVSGNTGFYDISGTVQESIAGNSFVTSGAALTLTNLDISATTANVADEIVFDSSQFPVFALPANGVANVDGNWTTGSSNAPATISGASVGLSGWNVGNWQWASMVGNGQEFVLPFSQAVADSTTGSVFATTVVSAPMPDLITPYYFFTATQADWTSVRGKLSFNLVNSGDGIWMPGSAEILTGDLVSTVPLPSSMVLLVSGALGLAGFATRRKSLSEKKGLYPV